MASEYQTESIVQFVQVKTPNLTNQIIPTNSTNVDKIVNSFVFEVNDNESIEQQCQKSEKSVIINSVLSLLICKGKIVNVRKILAERFGIFYADGEHILEQHFELSYTKSKTNIFFNTPGIVKSADELTMDFIITRSLRKDDFIPQPLLKIIDDFQYFILGDEKFGYHDILDMISKKLGYLVDVEISNDGKMIKATKREESHSKIMLFSARYVLSLIKNQ